MNLPSLSIAVAINEAIRAPDEWFEEADELDRVERALDAVEGVSDTIEAAALLAHAVAKAQGFAEGNKRTAILLARWVLDRNGLDGSIIIPPTDRRVAELLVQAASGTDVRSELVATFRQRASQQEIQPFPLSSDDEARLSDDQFRFLEEIRRMVLVAGQYDAGHYQAIARVERFGRTDLLSVVLGENDSELEIEVSVESSEITIAMNEPDWGFHWHFTSGWNDVYGEMPDRLWTSLAVDFLAELIHGEVRIRATKRGRRVVRVHAEVTTSDGVQLYSGATGDLGLLNVFSPRSLIERTIRFGQ